MCSLPIYQLMKRTFSGRGPSTCGCLRSLPTAISQAVSITVTGAREEALRQIGVAGLEAFAQQRGFLRRHRHALAVDRIEAAQGVAEHQIALRESRQPLVAPAQVGGIAEADEIAQRLGMGNMSWISDVGSEPA